MEKKVTCVSCGHALTATRGAHRYTESGLSNVTLLNIETRTCAACGEREVVIPRMEELHRLIARTIAFAPTKLNAETVRFLRKWLGFSAADFALAMGVRPETVSRWESATAAHPISPTAEHLLRVLVANSDPVEQYPIDLLKTQPKARAEPLRFKAGPGWKRQAA
jgi:putative zinc finger/helix-turn-helix YgiT family protein